MRIHVGRDHSRARELERERHGDCAAPGADVAEEIVSVALQRRCQSLDEELALRSWDERMRSDDEIPSVKLFVTGQIRDGLALHASRNERSELSCGSVMHRLVLARPKPHPGFFLDVRKPDLRL